MTRLSLAGLAIWLAVFAGAGSASVTKVPKNAGAPTIAGVPQEGGVLAGDHGRWNDTDVSFGYQWRRCLANGTGCANIPNATDRIYTPRADDVGRALDLVVAATNRHRRTGYAVSAPTHAIAALAAQAPHASSAPVIVGSATAGQVLTASAGVWAGAAPITFGYRWRRCDASGGNCEEASTRSQAYTLGAGDVGRRLRVLVIAVNTAGASAWLSDPSALVSRAPTAPAKPLSTSAPAISGRAEQGQTLRGNPGRWANHPTSLAYAWLRCDPAGGSCAAVGGAHQSSYSTTSADVGHTLRFEVQASNAGGAATAVSSPSAVVVAPAPKSAAPANTSGPTIAGTAQEGKTLTGDRGAWSNNPTSYSYLWRRCDSGGHDCDGIGGAHGTSYALTGADIGHTIRFQVEAANQSGSAEATSSPSAVVRAAARPGDASAPEISGTPQEGRALSGNRGAWTHSPSFAYAWLRCDRAGGSCASIGGAGGTTYTLTSADVGNTVRFHVVATNSEGSSSATSDPSAVIQKAPAAPPPSRGPGCPAGGNPDQVANLAPPVHLVVDALTSDPRIVTRSTATLAVRFHVTSTCGGPVQGALVYATATPFDQFTIPPEVATGSDGWATLVFQRMTGFPVSPRQQLIAFFVRARKPGESLFSGITARRLVSVPVRLG